MLNALLGDGALTALQGADWEEWSDFVETLSAWLDEPKAATVTLSGSDYTLPEARPDGVTATGVFAAPADRASGYTAALLAHLLPDKPLVLVSCADGYTVLMGRHRDALKPYYHFACPELQTVLDLDIKENFYRACEAHGLSYPKTATCNAQNYKNIELPFAFPVIIKASNSPAYWNCTFPHKKKVFLANNREEFDAITAAIYGSSYQDELILQEYIPGDDNCMRVLNAYCGLDHKVKLMALGRPLLEEQTPEGIGNYAAILSDPEYNDAALLEKLKNFLEDMQWEGFANMDIKYDARTGEYKMFEMNPRQGRSSYFVTAAGYNLSKWLVEDVLEHKELGLTIADTKSLWMIAPYGVIKKYLKDPDLLARADKLKKEGKCAHQLFCKEDWNLKRWLWYIRSQLNYYRKTARYYGNKGLRD